MSENQNTYKSKASVGLIGEQFVGKVLQDSGIEWIKNPEAKNRKVMILWDLQVKLDDLEFTIEVKFDQMESKTGNVAIEYYNVKQEKGSGIAATTSNLWIFVLSNPLTAWVCNTEALRQYVDNNKCHKHIPCGGDKNAALKLYKREKIFQDLFFRIDNLPAKELKSTLIKLLK